MSQDHEAYLAAFEAGALTALRYVADQRPDLADNEVLTAAERVGMLIGELRESGDTVVT